MVVGPSGVLPPWVIFDTSAYEINLTPSKVLYPNSCMESQVNLGHVDCCSDQGLECHVDQAFAPGCRGEDQIFREGNFVE
jgi:hypothetical protein